MPDLDFYCCYLLRSISKPNSFYIGSTPNPFKRLRQHNGEISGGASKTQRDGKRPWRMLCLVAGFQSNVSALQFEAAWQKYYNTRHISDHERVAKSRGTLGIDKHLANLRLLVKARAFSKIPLEIHLFEEISVATWIKNKYQISVPDAIPIQVDVRLPTSMHMNEVGGGKLLEQIESRIEQKRLHLLKCLDATHKSSNTEAPIAVCPADNCNYSASIFEFARLVMSTDTDSPLPESHVHCPGCGRTVEWNMIIDSSRITNTQQADSKLTSQS